MKFTNKMILTLCLVLNIFVYAKDMDIYANVSANINSIKDINSIVKKGQTLISLDDKLLLLKIKEQNEILKLKKVYLDDAYKNYTQDKDLYEKTVISQKELDKSTLIYLKAKYEYQAQDKKIQFLKNKKIFFIIKAPFDCKVISIPNYINTTNKYNPKILMKIKKL